jgi:predicted HTH domain antitoxin
MITESDHENKVLKAVKLFESGAITMSQAAKVSITLCQHLWIY